MSDAKRIPTNLRTLLILETLGRSDQPMTATEINRHIGLPKQTVHRLCTTLEREGFIVRERGGNKLRPARRLRELGSGLLHTSQGHIARRQLLMGLAREVGETVNFVVPEETGMNYLDRVETDWPFRIQLPIGSNVPFHCTASGKTFISTLPPRARKAFVGALRLHKLTAHTLVTEGALLDDLALSAKRGYALDREEFMDGMVAISVPVRDPSGRYIASLAFHGPAQRMSLEQAIKDRLSTMQNCAEKLGTLLFE